ncbi:hypothetical protein EKG83_11225 [Saccharothrix syringae]|uniref:Uncharacterized protein n=1 Tax=Saccharothrix syringae TaxID=103733 RepID=A0A5Q0HEA8_SACSY|nr:hypothetical protein EKG83_11225 [Saccharothrix syringae]
MVRPLLVLLALFAALAVAPAAASASPAADAAARHLGWSEGVAPVTGHRQMASDDVSTNAVFACNYFGRAPFYLVDFTCQVTSGAIQLFLDCSDGNRYFSAVLPAVGTYNLRGVCGPPATVVNFGAIQLA